MFGARFLMKLKPFLIALAIVLGLAGAVAGIKALQIGALIASGENEQAPVETVSAPVYFRP